MWVRIPPDLQNTTVMKMVAIRAIDTRAERRAGSTPASGTKMRIWRNWLDATD